MKGLYPDLEITSRRLSGIPATALAHAAASADTLVPGSRGLGSNAGFMLGSIGAGTIAAADQPVVLVRAPPPVVGCGPGLDPGVQEEIGRGIATAVDEMIRPWCEKYPSVTVTPEVRIGQSAIQLVDASKGAAPVLVGRRIRRSAYGTRIGAIAHAVLHHATAPVAVIAHE
ncbi:universal stress protein [Streptomyces sp. NPDC058401]|uniref:universal stress protein n=1 Tax=Streptomyces sp. NPDC058401 TaxID=3346480 RepID=UPI003655D916